VIAPVYGLPNVRLGWRFPPPGRGPLIDCIRRDRFMRSGYAEVAERDEADVLRIVACGRPLPGHEVRIVDATGRELGERWKGISNSGGRPPPEATSQPGADAIAVHGEWLDSGDFAYLAGATST